MGDDDDNITAAVSKICKDIGYILPKFQKNPKNDGFGVHCVRVFE